MSAWEGNGPYEVTMIMSRLNCENIHTYYLEKLISSYCFLNKHSKELFDCGVGIHPRKEDFMKKKKKKKKIFHLYFGLIK